MTILVASGLTVLGGVGAVLRLLVDEAFASRSMAFPFGTLAINLSGAFGLGLIVGISASSDVYRLLGTGLIGAFTTFSTWMFESRQLARGGDGAASAINLALSLAAGLLLAFFGDRIGAGL